jgi:two-component system response regulator
MMSAKTILLVEDNPDDEELTLRALNKHHLVNQVVVARDGAEALDYLFGRGPHAGRPLMPELVLLDLKLPKIDGLGVLQQLRANESTKLLPVVILTSSVEDRDRIAGYARGANSYVRKPVDFLEFVEGVRQLGMYWLLLNQPPPKGHPSPISGNLGSSGGLGSSAGFNSSVGTGPGPTSGDR